MVEVVKYEFDSVKSLIKTLDLEPNHGWKIPFEEFYLERTDKPKPDKECKNQALSIIAKEMARRKCLIRLLKL